MEKTSQNRRLVYHISLKNKLNAYDNWKTSSSLSLRHFLKIRATWTECLSTFHLEDCTITRTVPDRVKGTVWVEEINQAFPTEGAGTRRGWLEEWQSRSEEKNTKTNVRPKAQGQNRGGRQNPTDIVPCKAGQAGMQHSTPETKPPTNVAILSSLASWFECNFWTTPRNRDTGQNHTTMAESMLLSDRCSYRYSWTEGRGTDKLILSQR